MRKRSCHLNSSRRNKRAQWIADANRLLRAALRYSAGGGWSLDDIGMLLVAKSEAKRARRLAARRAQ